MAFRSAVGSKYIKVNFDAPDITLTTLTNWLRKNGLSVKRVNKTLTVNSRQKVNPTILADEIERNLQPDARRVKTVAVNVRGNSIVVSMALRGNPGLDNEKYIHGAIMDYIKFTGGAVDVVFADKKTEFLVPSVTRATLSGKDVSGNKKADIVLSGKGGAYSFSLKQSNASYYSSADGELSPLAGAAVEYAIKNNTNEITIDRDGVRKIIPDIAVKMSDAEATFHVFGSDIRHGKGAVLVGTPTGKDIEMTADGSLLIVFDAVVQSLRDLGKEKYPVLQIRNDKTRNRSHPVLRGLRAMVATTAVVPKNAVYIDRRKLKV